MRKMKRTKPPFRADHVGSLLRPAALKEARAKRARARSRRALKAVEDREIERAIKKQEEVGLKSSPTANSAALLVALDFLWPATASSAMHGERGRLPGRRAAAADGVRVAGKVGGFTGHPMIEHFKFVAAHTKLMPKMTIPSPSALHFRAAATPSPERSIPTWTISSAISARRTARRCAPSPTPAAAICSSTRSTRPICATRS